MCKRRSDACETRNGKKTKGQEKNMGMYGSSEGGTRVTVKKNTLLVALRKNREGHRAVFLKAQEGFRRLCIEHLDKMLANAKEGRAFALSVGLKAPQDHTNEYDVNIQMLE